MKNIILLIMYVFFCFNGTLTFEYIDISTYRDNNNRTHVPPSIIGGIPYNFFDEASREFCDGQCYPKDDVSYPSSYNYPKLSFTHSVPLKSLNLINADKSSFAYTTLHSAINDVLPNENVSLEWSIGWIEGRSGIVTSEIIVTWNSKETFFIMAFKAPIPKTSTNYISLGRGLEKHQLDIYADRPDMYVFRISGRQLQRLGCVVISEFKEKSEFRIYPNSISNMGGDIVNVQGPCPNNSDPFEIRISKASLKTKIVATAILSTNDKRNGFVFTMPMLWHSGVYVFQFTIDNKVFETEAEVYTMVDYALTWNITETKNDGTCVSIIPKDNSETINFNILSLDLTDKENKVIPVLKTHKFACLKDKTICLISLKDLSAIQFMINTDIGFFSMNSSSQGNNLSPPFQLTLLSSYRAVLSSEYSVITDYCIDVLRSGTPKKIGLCPDHLTKMLYSMSMFHGDHYKKMSLDPLNPELSNKECYIRIFKSDVSPTGVTCCYKTDGQLIYGQDFYLYENPLVASYAWEHSPMLNPYLHYFIDRLPLIKCCSMNKYQKLCAEYWEKFNNIKILETFPDYAGNVFGDPHFMPFQSQFSYSYLSRGEYWIIKGSDDFCLQGRFYSNVQSRSTLKTIAFSFNARKIMISIERDSKTISNWMVSMDTTKSVPPINYQDFTIFQSSDTKKLYIYLKIKGIHFVHMEISRFHYLQEYDEYLNLKIFISNKLVVDDGLMGKMENTSAPSSLLNRETSQAVGNCNDQKQINDFALSWRLKKLGESIFTYRDNESFDTYQKDSGGSIINYKNDEYCGSIKFCSIDKDLYPGGDFANITKTTYEKREEFNNNLINASNAQYRSCGHPPWPYIRIDSDIFNGDRTLTVINCTDESMKMASPNQKLICNKSNWSWTGEPLIDATICVIPPSPSKQVQDALISVYVVVPLVIILLVVMMVLSFIYIKKRRNNNSNVMKSEFSTTSQDPLHGNPTIPLDDVYDTWQSTKNPEDDYGVYSKIQKPSETANK